MTPAELKEQAKLQQEIYEWHEKTFPDTSLISVARHLLDETQELTQAIQEKDFEGVPGEVADCIILGSILQQLLIRRIAPALKVNVTEAVRAKHEKNKTRTYTYDPKLGYAKGSSEETPAQRAKRIGIELVH